MDIECPFDHTVSTGESIAQLHFVWELSISVEMCCTAVKVDPLSALNVQLEDAKCYISA